MQGSVIDRLVVAVGFSVDRSSYRMALRGFQDVSAAAAGAAAAVVGLAVRQAALDDQRIKTARALQMTAEDYTRLAFAFDRNGVSAGEMRVAVRTLQRQLLQASRGSAESAEAFEALGVRATAADGSLRTAAETMPEVIEALRTMDDRGRAAAISLVLFGRSGDQMGTLIQGGSAGLEELTRRADELGVTLSTEAGEAAERLTDAVTDLRGVSMGFSRTLAEEFIPPVTRVVEGLTEWAVANKDIIDTRIEQWGRLFGSLMDALATDAGRSAAAVVALGAALGGLEAARNIPILSTLARAGARGGPYALAALAIAAGIDEIVVAAEGGETAMGGVLEALEPGSSEQWQEFAKSIVDGAGDASRAVRDLASAFGDAVDEFEALVDIEIPPFLSGALSFLSQAAQEQAQGASTVSSAVSLQRGEFANPGVFAQLVAANVASSIGLESAGERIRRSAIEQDLLNVAQRGAEIRQSIEAGRLGVSDPFAGAPAASAPNVSVSVSVDRVMTRDEIADAAANELRQRLQTSDALEGY